MLGFLFAIFPIVGETLTAYVAETPEGTVFVPFTKVHPLVPATPLVIFG